MVPNNAVDLSQLEPLIDEYRGQKGAAIPVLQKTQKLFGYVPPEALKKIAEGLRIPVSSLYGVVTFYSQFYLTPRGRHIIRQCDGTACHVKGAAKIVERMEKELGISVGETTPDYKATCEVVYCLGSCGLAPVAVVDDVAIGKLNPEKMAAVIRELA
jgi:NADH-quinone oxidoreductase subunit E